MGETLSITANCAAALKALRNRSGIRTLWVDAICIDQSNVVERSAQISLMSRIYKLVSQAIIYAGEEDGGSRMAMDCVNTNQAIIDDICSKEFSKSKVPFIPPTLAEVDAMRRFLKWSWFGRIWVLQEVASSSSTIVLCSSQAMSWETFSRVVRSELVLGRVTNIPFALRIDSVYTSWHIPEERFTATTRVIFHFLCSARHCGSSDPKDKVFALLPLISLTFGPIPISLSQYDVSELVDYSKSIAEIFTNVAMLLMVRIGLNIFKAVQGRSDLIGLPSWTPDWSICETREPDLDFLDTNIWNPTEADLQFSEPEEITRSGAMFVRGFRVGTITDIGRLCNVCPQNWDSKIFRE